MAEPPGAKVSGSRWEVLDPNTLYVFCDWTVNGSSEMTMFGAPTTLRTTGTRWTVVPGVFDPIATAPLRIEVPKSPAFSVTEKVWVVPGTMVSWEGDALSQGTTPVSSGCRVTSRLLPPWFSICSARVTVAPVRSDSLNADGVTTIC